MCGSGSKTVSKKISAQSSLKSTAPNQAIVSKAGAGPAVPAAKSAAAAESERKRYLNDMLEHSRDINLKAQIRAAEKVDDLDLNDWSFVPQIPENVLAVPVRESKKKSAEEDKVKEEQKEHPLADVCTIRELPLLTQYFAQNNPFIEHPDHTKERVSPALGALGPLPFPVPGEDTDSPDEMREQEKANIPVLRALTDSILNTGFDPKNITDEYLSCHIHEVYDYAIKLRYFNNQIITRHAYFLDELNEEERLALKTRAIMAEPLRALIDAHLKSHGLRIVEDEEKDVVGRTFTVEHISPYDLDYGQNPAGLFDALREDFLTKSLLNAETSEARLLANDDQFNAANVLQRLEKKLAAAGDEKLQACYAEINTATAEIQRAMEYRDELFAEQKRLLSQVVDKDPLPPNANEILDQIAKNNKRVRLATKHADNYREFIEYAIGDRESLSESLLNFIAMEGQDQMLAIPRFRESIDALNRAALLNSGADLAGFKETGTGDFMEEFAIAKSKVESIKEMLDKGEKNRADARKAAETLAEENGMVRVENKGFSGNFIDPMMDPDTFVWVVLASEFKATEATPAEFKREIALKGVQPFLDQIDGLDQKSLEAMRVNKDSYIGSSDYWKNRTILGLLAGGKNSFELLELLRKNDVPVSEDQYEKIRAIGDIARGMYAEYQMHDEKMTDPLRVLAADSRYAADLAGIKDQLEDKQTGSSFILRDIVTELVRMREPKKVSTADFDKQLAAMHDKNVKRGISADRKKLLGIYTDKAELERFASYRYAVRKESFAENFPAPGATLDLWMERMTGLYGEGENIMMFRRFLRSVEKDKNGVPLGDDETRAAYQSNIKDIEDFVSGDTKRRNRVLKDIGNTVLYGSAQKADGASILGLDPKYADFNYIRDNYLEVRDYCLKMEAFRQYYAIFTDVFDSEEMFSEDERKAFKENIIDNEALTGLIQAVKEFAGLFGLNIIEEDKKISKDSVGDQATHLQGLLTGDLNKLIPKKDTKKKADKPDKPAQPKAAVRKPSDRQTAAFKKFERDWDMELSRLKRAHHDEVLRRRAAGGFRSKLEEAQFASELKQSNERKVTRMLRAKQVQFPEIEQFINGEISELSPATLQFVFENGISLFDNKNKQDLRFKLEKSRMGRLYTNDADVNLRIMMKDIKRTQQGAMPEDLKIRWREKFGKDAKGIGDPEIFGRLLLPVRRDWIGRPLKGSRHHDAANRAIVEAFLNDDRAMINEFLRNLGAEMAGYSKKYSAALTMDTFMENPEESYIVSMKMDLFGTIYNRYMDFFESDAFSPVDKMDIRMVAEDSQLNKDREAFWEALRRKIGLEKNLTDMDPNGGNSMNIMRNMAPREMQAVASSIAIDTAKQQRVHATYSTSGQRLDALSTLMAPQVMKSQSTGEPEAKKRAGLFGEVRKLLLGYTQKGEPVRDLSPQNKSFMSRFLDRFRKKERTVPEGGHWTLKARRKGAVPEAPDMDEAAELKDMQKNENPDADLGTVRVMRIMQRYFDEAPHKVFGADGRATDNELRVYLDHLLKRKLHPGKLDDEYLMIHAAELFEYSASLKDLARLQQLYPAYFAALSGSDKEELSRTAGYAALIDDVLKQHFTRHRLNVDGVNSRVSLTAVEAHRDQRSLKDRLARFDKNLAASVSSFAAVFKGEDAEIHSARQLATDTLFNGAYEQSYIGGLKIPDGMAGTYVTRLSAALQQEIQRRNTAIQTLTNEIGQYDHPANDGAKTTAKKNIDAAYEQILEISDTISEYFDLLRFAAGDIPFISDDKVRAMSEKRSDGSDKDTIGIYREMVADLVIEAGQAIESEEKKAAVQAELKAKVDAIAAREMAKKIAPFKTGSTDTAPPQPTPLAATAAAATAAAATAPAPSLTVAESSMKDKRKNKKVTPPQPAAGASAVTKAPETPEKKAPKKAAQSYIPDGKKVDELFYYTKEEKDRVRQLMNDQWVDITMRIERDFQRLEKMDPEARALILQKRNPAISIDDVRELLTRSEMPNNPDELGLLRNALFFQEPSLTVDMKGKWVAGSMDKYNLTGDSVKQGIDWLRSYYEQFLSDDEADQAKDFMISQAEEIKDVHVEVSYPLKYESQGTNNCFCCTGAALFNQYVLNADGKKTLKKDEMVTQTMLRNFHPTKFRDEETFLDMYLSSQQTDRSDPDIGTLRVVADSIRSTAIHAANGFMGNNTSGIGSIFEIADAFLAKRKDLMMYRMRFGTPKMERDATLSPIDRWRQYAYQKNAFVKQVAAVLSTGNLVGILQDNDMQLRHYRTITAVHGNMMTLMDSMNPDIPQIVPVDDLLRRLYSGNSVELTWFKKIEDPAKLAQTLPVQYSAEKGFETTPANVVMVEELNNVAHLNGITCGLPAGEMPDVYDVTGQRLQVPMVETAVYIPKQFKKHEKA